ncbi:hypothetical protein TrRE_jg4870 [Triparma retinervis]|uniref:Galactokinase n=1 Tax=Triparma retinervis TaxID=2557542 RepID=A0A9W7A782_9STRA|nr:hypothetical protein TrRE_jg4870 [Triparma retinervis]
MDFSETLANKATQPITSYLPSVQTRLKALSSAPSPSNSPSIKSILIRAPGRVNLLGEHVDYSGFGVLPMALTQYDVSLSIRSVTPSNPTSPSSLTISNLDPDLFETRKYDTSDPKSLSVDLAAHHWSHYFLAGYLGAFDSMPSSTPPPPPSHIEVIISGNVPSGAGLSSSSALVVASTLAAFSIYGVDVTRNDLALAAIEGERYVGTLSGGMDQSASILSREGMALNIEFVPSLTSTPVALPEGVAFVICNCLKKKEKAVDASLYYNKRVVECRLAALCIAKEKGLPVSGVRTLRDVVDKICGKEGRETSQVIAELADFCRGRAGETGPPTLPDVSAALGVPAGDILGLYFSDRTVQCGAVLNDSPTFDIWLRSRHVFEETLRVRGVLSLPLLDPSSLGSVMDASHASCRDLFDCSCPELEDLVRVCRGARGAKGARLTGAGWGGCAVACVEEGKKEEFIEEVKRKYYGEILGYEEGKIPEGSICVSLGGAGASIVEG